MYLKYIYICVCVYPNFSKLCQYVLWILNKKKYYVDKDSNLLKSLLKQYEIYEQICGYYIDKNKLTINVIICY